MIADFGKHQCALNPRGLCEDCSDALKESHAKLFEALEEIARECSGALDNDFPEDAPDILANVAGIAVRAIKSAETTPTQLCKCFAGSDNPADDCPVHGLPNISNATRDKSP